MAALSYSLVVDSLFLSIGFLLPLPLPAPAGQNHHHSGRRQRLSPPAQRCRWQLPGLALLLLLFEGAAGVARCTFLGHVRGPDNQRVRLLCACARRRGFLRLVTVERLDSGQHGIVPVGGRRVRLPQLYKYPFHARQSIQSFGPLRYRNGARWLQLVGS